MRPAGGLSVDPLYAVFTPKGWFEARAAIGAHSLGQLSFDATSSILGARHVVAMK